MHCHTSTSSTCSKFTPKEIVELYTSLGYDGIFITDHAHYYKNLENLVNGYYEVKKEAENTTLKVFFGVELSLNDAHFLVYGLSPKWHLSHPEIGKMSNKQAILFYRDNGATIIQAHPYRIRKRMDGFELYPYYVDGVELYNSGNEMIKCPFTKTYSKYFKLPVTAGSDIHRKSTPILSQFISYEPINTENDYIKILKKKNYKIKTIKNPFSKRRNDAK